MTKPRRLHYKNAKYHVMLRGNYKQAIFQSDDDYLKMYQLMDDVSRKYSCRYLMFCLMTNHTHMVIEVSDIPLSKVMQSFVSRYSRYFNKKCKVVGHLFQGRYLAKPIMNEKYLLELCYYIHNNPLAANICNKLDGYRWSSHRHYRNLEYIPWLSSKKIIKFLQDQFDSKENYYDLLLSSHGSKIDGSLCEINSDGLLTISQSPILESRLAQKIDVSCLTIKEISQVICQYLQISNDELSGISLNRRVVLGRALAAYFSHYHGGYQLNHIALSFNQNPDSLSLNLHKQLMKKEVKKMLDEISQYFIRLLKINKNFVSDLES